MAMDNPCCIAVESMLKVECLVEDSVKNEDARYTEKYYSEHKAWYLHHSFVLKARKL